MSHSGRGSTDPSSTAAKQQLSAGGHRFEPQWQKWHGSIVRPTAEQDQGQTYLDREEDLDAKVVTVYGAINRRSEIG